MTITDVADIFPTAAADLLVASASVLDTDAPASQMVILGPATAPNPSMNDECEGQLTVAWGPTFPSKQLLTRDPTGPQQCQVITVIQLTQTLFVCAPTMTEDGSIDDGAITSAAMALTRVASKWWFGLLGLGPAGIFTDLPNIGCSSVNWGQLTAGSNLGGVQALTWTLTLSIS